MSGAPQAVLLIQGRTRTLEGYPYFWIKAVTGFDATQHCARSLRGSWVICGADKMPLNRPTPLALRPGAVGYICGVSEGFNYAKNLHIPFVPDPAAPPYRIALLRGQMLTLTGAKVLLPIPPLPKGWAGLNEKFTTCRNFQFAVSRFGFSEAKVRALVSVGAGELFPRGR